jgi:hypothetical protein
LLLAGQSGGELVGVLEPPAKQRLAVGGPRPRCCCGGAELGRPGRRGLDELPEAVVDEGE